MRSIFYLLQRTFAEIKSTLLPPIFQLFWQLWSNKSE